jgi:hypothetical protein
MTILQAIDLEKNHLTYYACILDPLMLTRLDCQYKGEAELPMTVHGKKLQLKMTFRGYMNVQYDVQDLQTGKWVYSYLQVFNRSFSVWNNKIYSWAFKRVAATHAYGIIDIPAG